MRFLIGTAHFFAPIYRDAGMHRFAKSLAAKGHHVDFVTFGQSRLKKTMKAETKRYIESAEKAAAEGANPENIHARVHRELFHPPSGSAKLEKLTAPLLGLYGRSLDTDVARAAAAADVVILECGYAVCWYPAIRKLAPNAIYMAFYNDRLDLVGFRPDVIALNHTLLPQFDMVRTNAERLLDYLPPDANGRYVPQGVDKMKIRFDLPSPYAPGTRNIVSVGNMLFDADAVRSIAAADPGVTTHVIGAAMENPPANVVVHGELPFETTLPYIVHADVGLAPYRPEEGGDYLVQSSLKIQQYSYCGLPILLNRVLGITGRNMVQYELGRPGGVSDAVARAFAMGKARDYGSECLDWSEVGDVLLEAIASLSARKVA
jgi:2-beta-glucuronyltransferase